MRWWDTSALLSLIVGQRQTEDLKKLFSANRGIVAWWGTKVEGVSGIARLHREGHLGAAETSQLLKALDALLSAAYEVQPTEEVRTTACRVLRVHELRAADAFQLAAALVWSEHRPAGMAFVCLDRRLRDAAAREGFDVLPSRD